MLAEVLGSILAAIIGTLIIGSLIALPIKAFRRSRPIPKWPYAVGLVVYLILHTLAEVAKNL